MTANLVLPKNFVELDNEEMMYVEGGSLRRSIARGLFVATSGFLVTAAIIKVTGGLGLKFVLGSMDMKKGIAKNIVNKLGRVGIRVNNLTGSKLGTLLSRTGFGGLAGHIFDNHIWRQ